MNAKERALHSECFHFYLSTDCVLTCVNDQYYTESYSYAEHVV